MTLAIAKWCKVNEILSALCHEKNIYLIDLNKGKLYLNKNGSNILNCTFVNEISKIFNWLVNVIVQVKILKDVTLAYYKTLIN